MPPPLLVKKNATIILKKHSSIIPKFEKKTFHLFVELVEKYPLIYNTLQFDQYSRLAILLNIFWSSAKIQKTNLNKAFH